MKSRISFIAVLLLYLSVNTVAGQSTTALMTPTGQFLVSDESITPPSNGISVTDLSAASQLIVLADGKLTADADQKVKSFKMTFIGKAGKVTVESEGDQLTRAMYDEMKKLQAGDEVYIEYIKSVSADGTTRSRSSMKFVIR